MTHQRVAGRCATEPRTRRRDNLATGEERQAISSGTHSAPDIDISALTRGLSRTEDNIWHAGGARPVSYPSDAHSVFFELEDASFWFRHRNQCIAAMIKRWPAPTERPMLDVGGGNGCVSAHLNRCGLPTVLVEPGAEGARNARTRGVAHVINATLEQLDLDEHAISAIGLFDVLEHLKDDRAFLDLCAGILPPGGTLYLSVPAHRWLWSGEDDRAGHQRRYTRQSLSALLTAANYEVLHATYFFSWLLPPQALLRAAPSALGFERKEDPKSTHVHADSWMGRTLLRLLAPEIVRIAAGRPVPVGASLLVAARRLSGP